MQKAQNKKLKIQVNSTTKNAILMRSLKMSKINNQKRRKKQIPWNWNYNLKNCKIHTKIKKGLFMSNSNHGKKLIIVYLVIITLNIIWIRCHQILSLIKAWINCLTCYWKWTTIKFKNDSKIDLKKLIKQWMFYINLKKFRNNNHSKYKNFNKTHAIPLKIMKIYLLEIILNMLMQILS